VLDKKDILKIEDLIQSGNKSLEDRLGKRLEGSLGKKLESELRPIKSDLAKVRRDVDTMLDLFDRDILDLRNRVEKIEEILNIRSQDKSN